jgi:hypothetical protein
MGNPLSTNLTTTLTLLLVAAQSKAHEFEYRVHEIINELVDIKGWSDERKADLYAMLAETVQADDRMIDIEKKVHAALQKNEARYYGRVGV